MKLQRSSLNSHEKTNLRRFLKMKIINKIDDSFGTGTRIIHVVELASNIFVDVMVINDDIHSKNYAYIMDFDGGQAYVKTDNGDE